MQDSENLFTNFPSNILKLQNIDNEVVNAKVTKVHWDVSSIEKGDYAHFMLKEILNNRQPLAMLSEDD